MENNKNEKIPQHIGIIMDGNRRWAREKGLKPVTKGHEAGVPVLKKVLQWCHNRGVKVLTVWAFSTENKGRSAGEISLLFKLMIKSLKEYIKELNEKGVKFMVSGRIEDLPKVFQNELTKAIELTKNNSKGILNIALNYGGRAEIVDAVKNIIKQGLKAEQVDEQVISDHLYTSELPNPDLIIRTSGEQRLSGFLPWQSVYAELYFCPKYWPDFTTQDLEKALKSFQGRERRFGK